jgi:diaminopimelate epimerase
MEPRLSLWRAHGLGNDYLVLESGGPLDPALVRAICDRHRGVGSDGILEPAAPGAGAAHGVRIWNPDGSVAEKSGNGLRIYADWLSRRGHGRTFTVWTGHDVVGCVVGEGTVDIEMGHAVVGGTEIVDGLGVVPVDVGNPHAVVWVGDDPDGLPWRDWGRRLETNPRFPNRTNVQIARVAGPAAVEIRIWERGAGETLASGSSSCAVAAAAVATGRLPAGWIEVRMPGGVLRVQVREDLSLVLHGPVEAVGRIEVEPSWLAARGR